MGGTPRHRLIAALAACSLAWLIVGATSAAAGGKAQAAHPRAGHVGVVVTAGEVFVSWAKPLGAASATVTVRRGEPACPRHPGEGSAAGEVTPLHVIDRTVTAGQAYCYTVFLTSPTGLVTTIGTTGLVTVPAAHAVPPTSAPAPAPAPTVTVSRFSHAQVRKAEFAAGAALAGLLVLVIGLRSGRRMSRDRLEPRPAAGRATLVSRNSSALVVPAMIALGWVGIVIAFVVLR
jgi:hypothetical protein